MPTPPANGASRGTPRPAERPCRRARAAGFTLIELLVVVTVLLVLVALLMPVLGRALGQAKRVVCASNMRQLLDAWFVYQTDHGGRFVPAYTGVIGDTPGWVGDEKTEAAITNYALYPYTGSAEIYRCPCEPWPDVQHTYSINSYLDDRQWGDVCGCPNATRHGQLKHPSATFVFIEEYDDRGANLGGFVVDTTTERWIDSVASWHFGGINLAFADGHLEYWTWQDPRTLLLAGGHFISSPQNPDLRRLQQNVGCP